MNDKLEIGDVVRKSYNNERGIIVDIEKCFGFSGQYKMYIVFWINKNEAERVVEESLVKII